MLNCKRLKNTCRNFCREPEKNTMNFHLKIFFSATAMLLSVLTIHAQAPKNPVTISADDIIAARDKKAVSVEGTKYPYYEFLANKLHIKTDELSKKVIFLHFWFASCSPCLKEFEGLNALFERTKNDQNFVILSVTFENEKTIQEFRQRYQIKCKILQATDDDCNKLNLVGGFPVNILLDKNFRIDQLFLHGKKTEEETTQYFTAEIGSRIDQLLTHSNRRSAVVD